MITFSIPVYKINDLEKGVARINKRLQKLGIENPITTTYDHRFETRDDGQAYVWIDVSINHIPKEFLTMGDWTVVARLDHRDAGNIIRRIPSEHEAELPEIYRTREPWCDHCNVLRLRNETFVIYSEKEGYKQVGSTCLQDFTGFDTASQVMALANQIIKLEDLIKGQSSEPVDYSNWNTDYLSLPMYLGHVVHNMKKNGWISRGEKFRRGLSTCTADSALETMLAEVEISAADLATAQQAITWSRLVLANKDNLSEYEHNLVTVTANDYLEKKDIGIAASLMAIVKHDSNFVGEIGQKIKLDGVEAVLVKNVGKARFGDRYLNKMIDRDGNVIIWWSTKELEVGKKYSGEGVVSSHNEYNGERQTTISYVKVQEVG
jgi:hypothetical protein